MIEVVVFVVFAAMAIVGGLTMVASPNAVFSALGLMMAMFAMAGLYVLNDAHFIAAVQVLIYAGAVMTLFLFVMMLIGVDRDEDLSERLPWQRPLAVVLGLAMLVAITVAGRVVWVTGLRPTAGLTDAAYGSIEAVSDELFGTWLLAFEATVLLLTIAAVGTIALARFTPRPHQARARREDRAVVVEGSEPVTEEVPS